jgi:uncharacterized protein (DUF488 family)
MRTGRQQYIASFLQTAGSCSKMKLAKVFFLLKSEKSSLLNGKFYSFVPYKFGPYSFELFHDLDLLEQAGVVRTDKNNVYFQKDESHTTFLPQPLLDYLNIVSRQSNRQLINYVYSHYPDYTIFSSIEKKVEYHRDRTGIMTIGYEGCSIDEFLHRLILDKTQVLVDVRNNPWSMKYGFTKGTLMSFCEKLGIEYLGKPMLGVPRTQRVSLEANEDYQRLFAAYRKHLATQKGELERLVELSHQKRLALLCFEKDPMCCHRHVLGEELMKQGAEVTIE